VICSVYLPQPPVLGTIVTYAGTGFYGYSCDGGAATSSGLYGPQGVAVDAMGNVYIVEGGYNRVRIVTRSTGIISTYAGTGMMGSDGDGMAATIAQLNYPQGVAVDASGNVFIADTNNYKVRLVTKATGTITTYAGTGTAGMMGMMGMMGSSGDGMPATSTSLPYNTRALAVDSSGNLYIADSTASTVRMVTRSTGIMTTFAGTGTSGSSSDGGLASMASLMSPNALAVDASDNVYIAENSRVRVVTRSSATITTIAGTGVYGSSCDGGAATSALLSSQLSVAVDVSGNVYIAESSRVRMVRWSTGIVTTIAGTGMSGSGGDGGDAKGAQLTNVAGVAVDASGNVFITDSNKVREVVAPAASAASPSAALNPVRLSGVRLFLRWWIYPCVLRVSYYRSRDLFRLFATAPRPRHHR